MNAPLDSFETALLTRLREHVDQQPAVRPRQSRPRLLVGTVATVAAAATMVVVVPSLGTAPAYSVQEGNSGTITVEVQRLEDAKGLESELARYGVNADITYVRGSQECASGRYTPVDRQLSGMEVSMGARILRVTLPPGTVRDGETFVMAVSGETVPPSSSGTPENGVTDMGGFSGWTDFNVTSSFVQPCKVVPGATS